MKEPQPTRGKLLVFPDYPRVMRELKVPMKEPAPRLVRQATIIDFVAERAKRRPVNPV